MHKPITKVSRVSEYYLSVRTHKLATLKERKIAYFIWRQKFDLTISLNSENYPKNRDGKNQSQVSPKELFIYASWTLLLLVGRKSLPSPVMPELIDRQ